uniref:kelch-like protein 10 n=1 Tax=Semicossyphus pulcher TaxID=241346 RepID=UPI0037E8E200
MTSAALTELRANGNLCDVVIKVGDVNFYAHKIVLCGCSLYFRTLFTGAWSTQDRLMYTITGVSPEAMNLIISYAYTRSVPLTDKNVVEALAAADQFLIPGMVQQCGFFFEDQLCLKNCISTWKLVDFYHCPELRNKVFHYIMQHFEEVALVSQELWELSVQQLTVIIENDHLNVKQEETVFEAVLSWINHLPQQRRSYISVLLPKVRLGLIATDYLQNRVIENALVKESIGCIPIINDAVTAFMKLRFQRRSEFIFRNLLSRPRLPPSILLVTGGKDGIIPASSVEVYDCRADCWVTVNTDGICRAHHGTAVLHNFVYLIGGCDQDTHLNTVIKLDLLSYTWHHVASMKSPRCYVSVAVLDGCIYAMGGCNGQVYYNTVECYRPETDQWTGLAAMRKKRSGASATTLNGKVYICGGFNGRRNDNSAEFYNPDTDTWTLIRAMRNCRIGLGVAAYKGHIYAVGGASVDSTYLCNVEAYNPQTNRWRQVPSMCNPRSYCGIEVVDDQLFVVGGYNGSNSMLTAERYNEEAGMWFSAAHMETSRSGLSCCVLHGLHSLAENLFARGPLMPPKVEEAAVGTI